MRLRSRGPRATNRSIELVWLVHGIALIYAAYFVLRFGGLWSENDTAVFSAAATQTLRTGTVLFPHQYSHGFAYPAWVASISALTGLSPAILNTIVLPYAGVVLLVATGFLAYRSLLNSSQPAVLGILLLLATPDLMFSVLRGNHEKLNIAFVLFAIYVLFRALDAMDRRGVIQAGIWAALYYAVIFANACTNDYFASGFTLALTVMLPVVALGIGMRSRDSRVTLLMVLVTVFTSWLVIGWVMFFVFPRDSHDLNLIRNVQAHLRNLFLSLHPAANPYSLAANQWTNPVVGAVLSLFRWLLLCGSGFVWLQQGYRLIRRRSKLRLQEVCLLGLYLGFGIILVASIPLDLSGIGFGQNLELRNFTMFSLVAAPLLAWGLTASLDFIRRSAPQGHASRSWPEIPFSESSPSRTALDDCASFCLSAL